jgi:hypothetical protein
MHYRRRRSRSSASAVEELSSLDPLQQEIGFYGELFVFQYLKQFLDSSVSQENWTSRYRNRACSDPRMRQAEDHYTNFDGDERDYSDFTYVDDNGRLGAYLSQRGRRLSQWPGHPLTYHGGQVNDGPA